VPLSLQLTLTNHSHSVRPDLDSDLRVTLPSGGGSRHASERNTKLGQCGVVTPRHARRDPLAQGAGLKEDLFSVSITHAGCGAQTSIYLLLASRLPSPLLRANQRHY
jgi:hypothetical protein